MIPAADYNSPGLKYNQTRKADPYLLGRLTDMLSPSKDKKYIDIGCGSGNYTCAFSALGFDVAGIDPSQRMLELAIEKNHLIKWIMGSAEATGQTDHSFDGAFCTLTVHHWKDIPAAFKEIYRILKPGSRLLIFTSDPRQMMQYWLNHYFPAMLQKAIMQMPEPGKLILSAEDAGFKLIAKEIYSVRDDLSDMFLYSGKNRPEIYFDKNIQGGISSFMSLSEQDEVASGLSRLSEDINSGEFDKIRESFSDDEGDYLFLLFGK